MLNISSNSWTSSLYFPSISSQNTTRAAAACIAHNNQLYLVGGYENHILMQTSSIDVLNISDLDPFSLIHQTWSSISNTMPPLIYSRLIPYKSDILIIGGGNSNGNTTSVNEMIYSIDTNTNTFSISGALSIGGFAMTPIITPSTLYVFGGTNFTLNYNFTQYHSTLTKLNMHGCIQQIKKNFTLKSKQQICYMPHINSAPSTSPTTGPTTRPTAGPTTPSTSPTPYPSTSPTTPTEIPTQAPTSATSAPTAAPTDEPTIPTTQPSAAPSDAPTLPSTMPTNTPTAAPSIHIYPVLSLEEIKN